MELEMVHVTSWDQLLNTILDFYKKLCLIRGMLLSTQTSPSNSKGSGLCSHVPTQRVSWNHRQEARKIAVHHLCWLLASEKAQSRNSPAMPSINYNHSIFVCFGFDNTTQMLSHYGPGKVISRLPPIHCLLIFSRNI